MHKGEKILGEAEKRSEFSNVEQTKECCVERRSTKMEYKLDCERLKQNLAKIAFIQDSKMENSPERSQELYM
jgi:hypothetical protein